jgi:phosphohistidine phosphatase
MARDLYLVRHAQAIPRGSIDPDDHRWLTERGRRRFRKAARRFARAVGDEGPDLILTSPLPRALMTAEILAGALGLCGALEVCPQLAPAGALWAALSLLTEELQKGRRVAAVGHEPQLSMLLQEICGQQVGDTGLRKGAIAALRVRDDKSGKLRRLFLP